jgi:hydrogenase maturation factor
MEKRVNEAKHLYKNYSERLLKTEFEPLNLVTSTSILLTKIKTKSIKIENLSFNKRQKGVLKN